MAALTLSQFRSMLGSVLDAYNGRIQPGYDVPPGQLIEAQVDLETGGTFDPGYIDPFSGAVGLGQIMPGGLEWGVYKANHPEAKASDLTDPMVNLDVMVEGMSYRQAIGEAEQREGGTGAYADWFMASAGYLGGANNAGFNTRPDAYGTTGESYVRRVRQYINRVYGASTATSIDLLSKGSAVAVDDNWEDGEITYDPDAPAADDPGLWQRLWDAFKSGAGDIASGAISTVAGEVLSGIFGFLAAWAPRAGLALGGIAAAAIGFIVLTRAGA